VSARPTSPTIPHSWSVAQWPAGIFPGSAGKARYLIRTHKSDLVAAGAIVRVGRELVTIGSKYVRWLETHASRVHDYHCAANSSKG
jgi:hypothetical protein